MVHPPFKKNEINIKVIFASHNSNHIATDVCYEYVSVNRITAAAHTCMYALRPLFYCHCIYYIVNLTLSINILIYIHGSIVSRIDHGFISLSCTTKQRLHRKIIRISVTSLKQLEIPWRGCKHRRMHMITTVTTYIKAQLKKNSFACFRKTRKISKDCDLEFIWDTKLVPCSSRNF